MELGDLEIGEHLWTEHGPVEVQSKRLLSTAESVYNLEVHGHHIYQVGELGVLVHNAGGISNYKTVRFKGTKDMYKPKAGQKNTVNMKLTGSYKDDFAKANALAGLKKTPRWYVWHHVANLSKTGRATLELVKKSAHRKSLPHAGSCSQYLKRNGLTRYKT